MAKKIGKTEKTLLIAGGAGLLAFLLYKSGMFGGAGTNYYVPTNYQNGSSNGGSNVDWSGTVNNAIDTADNVLDKLLSGSDDGSVDFKEAIYNITYKPYKEAYDYMLNNNVTTYTFQKTGKTITFAQAKEVLQKLRDKFGWDY